MEMQGGIDLLESLQYSPSNEVYVLALQILDTYYEKEERNTLL
jgi:hypothetical protein